jgi:glycosyl transferase family 17
MREIRIYDSFPFDGELDFLEHRLTETYEMVDAFVLVEAGETYRGEPKEFIFQRHRDRFSWASPKLRYIKLASLGAASSEPRARAAIQRGAIMLGLRDIGPDDIVLLLDVDEIPSASLLNRLRSEGLTEPRRLSMTRHYQHLDTVGPSSPCCANPAEPFPFASPRIRPGDWSRLDSRWSGQSGVAVPARFLLGEPRVALMPRTPFDLRFGHIDGPPLADAGRHFSSVDPSTRLERKLGRMVHAEWAGDRAMRPVCLRRCRDYGVHHRGWWYAEAPAGELPDDLSRLAARCGHMARRTPLPRFWRRRLVRTWAWLRLCPGWREWMVTAIDNHFEELLPVLFVPLYAADALRAAYRAWARLGRRSSGPGAMQLADFH